MAEDANEGQAAAAENLSVSANQKKEGVAPSKKRRGVLSRIWNGIFRRGNEDFEKRLQHLSKEEASVHARMKGRAQTWRRTARNIIVISVILEVVAVGYAIMTTRSLDLDWKMRAVRVMPMFLLPAFSVFTYTALVNYTRMRDRKDQKTLERLRAERQAKIDELKERTNYYITQQLIQRYDPDPAAKAAAASVLASKLGADSGLKVYVGDESKLNVPQGKSNDIELVQSSGLRNRKQHLTGTSSGGSSPSSQQFVQEMPHDYGAENPEAHAQHQTIVEHDQSSGRSDGGFFARIAALLVGEDPAQCYALICGNCHMHNGLARKEDFPYVTYYCPHCHVLNRSRQLEGQGSSSISGKASSPTSAQGDVNSAAGDSEVRSELPSPLIEMVEKSAEEAKETSGPAT
ncbi:hypothetical protein AAC387_Pa03g2593 [Persea americana]